VPSLYEHVYIMQQFAATMASTSKNVMLCKEIDNALNKPCVDIRCCSFNSDTVPAIGVLRLLHYIHVSAGGITFQVITTTVATFQSRNVIGVFVCIF
jgi:hypothetical protein